MKVLIIDADGVGVDLAVRAHEAKHNVRYFVAPKYNLNGKGLVPQVTEWEPSMDWAELIVLTGNAKYVEPLAKYFGKGYPIFGTNSKAAELELDRETGQKIFKRYGIETLPYQAVDSIDEAIKLVASTGEAYAIKPWGGESNKAMTLVARDADEAIFMLEHWKAEGLSGKLMLQEKVDGVEIGISGFFGPGGWSKPLEESFEHKKFLNDDLGCNTGEMGTVIRHVKKSKLFDMVLEPLTDYLHELNYIGDCNVNCIVDPSGTPYPLEFTMRLGWPDFCIRQAVIQGDPVEWMIDLVHGEDTLEVSTEIAVGVLLAHGDFPTDHSPEGTWAGYPISGISYGKDWRNIHCQDMQEGTAPMLVGKKVQQVKQILTAGNYIMIVSGTGETVQKAAEAAYRIAWKIKTPSNIMFRTDIGKRLEHDLPMLQTHGYAKGMVY